MPGYEVTVTEKGQVTLPAELRARLNLKDGDKVEFYLDRSGRVLMRPRNLPPTAVIENAPKRKLKPRTMTDDEAIVAAIADKDRRSRRR